MSFIALEKLIKEYDENDLILRFLCNEQFFKLIHSPKESKDLSGKYGNHSFLCLVIEALAKISETNDRLSLNQLLAKLSGSQIESIYCLI